jgi:hypothetical protein
LGLWEQCADAPDVEAGVRAECLYRLNRHGELLDAPHDTLWKALALHRDGRADSARCVLGKAADRHRDAAYVLSASPPELRHLAGHYERQQLADIAGLYRDCALLLRT